MPRSLRQHNLYHVRLNTYTLVAIRQEAGGRRQEAGGRREERRLQARRELYQFRLHWDNIRDVGAQSLRPPVSMFYNQKARFLIILMQPELIL
ncbi:MAG: hypothetical protein F6J86_35060 [Symploca sp. SIO1B1]|nr:hypothetical protein [Symploca sp. SIO1B1]